MQNGGNISAHSVELDSAALTRLVAEVRDPQNQQRLASYNRTYNRHNR